MLPTPLPFSSFSISGMVAMETEASGQEQLLGTGQLGLLGGPGRRGGLLLCVHPTPNAATGSPAPQPRSSREGLCQRESHRIEMWAGRGVPMAVMT